MRTTFLFSAVLALGIIAAPASQALVIIQSPAPVQKPVVKVVKPAVTVVKPAVKVVTPAPAVKNTVVVDSKLVNDKIVKKGQPAVIKRAR